MRGTWTRRVGALVAAAALPATLLISAEPALACDCGTPEVDADLADGQALAIVTRTDDDAGGEAGAGARTATFRVEHAVGAELPAQLSGEMDSGASCQPYVPPQGVAALLFERRGGDWHLGSCSQAELGPALERVLGAPGEASGRPAVAYLAGSFGGSRLAAVDRQGQVVAWADRGGHGEQVATCPGADRVVAAGRSAGEDYRDRDPELTVHDAATLTVARAVPLPTRDGSVLALACRDGAARSVEVLVDASDDAAILLFVDGDRVRRTRLPALTDAVATSEGFLALTDGHDGPAALLRIGADGTQEVLVESGDLGYSIGIDRGTFTVSPDERTVTVFGYSEGDDPLLTIDTGSGERVGRWTTEDAYVTGLAWTASNRLLVRNEGTYRQSPVPLLVFDRELGEPGAWPAVPGSWGGRLGAVGEAAVGYGGTRLTVRPESGAPLVADELRLAAASHLVAVPGAEFAVSTSDATASPDADVAVAVGAAPADFLSVLGALGAPIAGAAVLGAALAVRRRCRAG